MVSKKLNNNTIWRQEEDQVMIREWKVRVKIQTIK